MTLTELLTQIKTEPEQVRFDQVMQVIEEYYDYTPSGFYNGVGETRIYNAADANQGSCRLFAFASLNQLDAHQTLACFGDFYRHHVLQHPNADNHGNIRRFMQDGWAGIEFEQFPLQARD